MGNRASTSAAGSNCTSSSLTVIIPALNEAAGIANALQSVRDGCGASSRWKVDTVVVDGGSIDATRTIARRHKARVLRSQRGRGRQLNVGWRASAGQWCLFLHADTRLPPGFLASLERAVAPPPDAATATATASFGGGGDDGRTGPAASCGGGSSGSSEGAAAGMIWARQPELWAWRPERTGAPHAAAPHDLGEVQGQAKRQRGTRRTRQSGSGAGSGSRPAAGACGAGAGVDQEEVEEVQLWSSCSAGRRQRLAAARHRQPVWGCFSTILTDVHNPHLRCLLSAGVALRTRLLWRPYGDQALFVRRDALEALGGFREWPLLEDLDLVLRLGKVSPPAILPEPVATSGRRWDALGFWRTTLVNQAILVAYALGVSPDTLAEWYRSAARDAGAAHRN